jgi:hypothetical protein
VVWCILIRTATFPTLRHASRGMSPGPAVIELPSASYQPLTCQGEYTDITSIGRCTDRIKFSSAEGRTSSTVASVGIA